MIEPRSIVVQGPPETVAPVAEVYGGVDPGALDAVVEFARFAHGAPIDPVVLRRMVGKAIEAYLRRLPVVPESELEALRVEHARTVARMQQEIASVTRERALLERLA